MFFVVVFIGLNSLSCHTAPMSHAFRPASSQSVAIRKVFGFIFIVFPHNGTRVTHTHTHTHRLCESTAHKDTTSAAPSRQTGDINTSRQEHDRVRRDTGGLIGTNGFVVGGCAMSTGVMRTTTTLRSHRAEAADSHGAGREYLQEIDVPSAGGGEAPSGLRLPASI